ncbi:MAG TPA: hypothetical protein VI583_03710 [Cyclobacteriaceae bacterium]|nr:hypothetical protein [Cyclobacteriaceae bacterium]
MDPRKLWSAAESEFLKKIDSPHKIQLFLDDIEYNSVIECQSPRWVIRKKRAHCFEGALFAAACLKFHGGKPLIIDLKAENDDDHVIAVYKFKNNWGAIAKSNFTTLRFREPVYRTIRELVMSYFDFYFNLDGIKSLRSYSLPVNVDRMNIPGWAITDTDLDPLGHQLNSFRHFPVIRSAGIKKLSLATASLMKSSLLGSNPAGLYKAKKQ